MTCFECSKVATEYHHIIPKSLGGTKTIPLCGKCHAKVHQMDGKRRDNISELTKIGLRKAKARGVVLGNPKEFTKEGRAKGRKVLIEKAKNNINNIKAIKFLKSLEVMNLREYCFLLNTSGYKTSRGSDFVPTTVKRLLERIKQEQNDTI